MSTVASVVLWLSLAGVVVFLAFSQKGRGIGKWFQSLIQPYEDTHVEDVSEGGRSPRGATVLYSMEEVSIEQLLNRRKTAAFPIRFPEADAGENDRFVYVSGPAVSRMQCEKGDVILAKGDYSATVSSLHLAICKDAEGYFLYDNDSSNGTWVVADGKMTKLQPKEPFPITDGMVVYLGRQPIRFRISQGGLPSFDETDARAMGKAPLGARAATRVDMGERRRTRDHVHRR